VKCRGVEIVEDFSSNGRNLDRVNPPVTHNDVLVWG